MHSGRQLCSFLMKLHCPSYPFCRNPLHSAFINPPARGDEVDPGVQGSELMITSEVIDAPLLCCCALFFFNIINTGQMRKRASKVLLESASISKCEYNKKAVKSPKLSVSLGVLFHGIFPIPKPFSSWRAG